MVGNQYILTLSAHRKLWSALQLQGLGSRIVELFEPKGLLDGLMILNCINFRKQAEAFVCRQHGGGGWQLTTHCGRLISFKPPRRPLTAWTACEGEDYTPQYH